MAIVLAVVVAYWQINESGAMATLLDGGALRQFIIGLGMAGPLAVIGLMILAILVSRIPSAPIALATLAGILPASFLLAHFGGEMAAGELDRIMYAVLALGLLTLVPLAAHYMRQRMRGNAADGEKGGFT